jgi:signal transduction histidine kinase/ABC-type uncharacterized transport system substrate-binding protein
MRRIWKLSIAGRHLHMRLAGILLAAAIGLGPPLARAATQAEAQPPPAVLIINQSDSYHPWPNTVIAEIRSAVRTSNGSQISIFAEHLDVFQFAGPGYESSLGDHYREKYRDKPIRVIVAIGPAALSLALHLRPALWPAATIVFCTVDEQVAEEKFPPGVTGTIIPLRFDDTVRIARRLLPDVRQFAIVGDRPDSQLYFRSFAHEVSVHLRDARFLDLMGEPLTEVIHRVAALPEHTAVLYIGINADQSGRYVASDLVAPIAQAANRPTFVNTETFFGSGAVGGFVLSPGQVGRETGRIVTRILAGEDASRIPITFGSPPKPLFDWRALQRWNISERLLPAGSEVRYRVPGMWEQYHMEILAACAVVLLQAALIVLLIYERRHRHAAEVAARVTMSELTRLDRVAAAGELSASIAHEVNQPLAGIALRAGAARRWLGREPPDLDKVRSALEQIVSASHHASDIVKGIRAMFKKDTQVTGRVDINDVIVLVLQLTRVEVRKHDIDVRTQLGMPLPPVVGDAVQLQQVILNLVMNAVEAMHASPRRILRIKSELDKSGGVHVSVEDTGPGIDPSRLDRVFKPLYTTKATGMGMGLTICHSIIARHNGRIWVSPGSEGGSSFQFIVPTAHLEADAAVHGKVME